MLPGLFASEDRSLNVPEERERHFSLIEQQKDRELCPTREGLVTFLKFIDDFSEHWCLFIYSLFLDIGVTPAEVNLGLFCLSLPAAGVTNVSHHFWHQF